MFACLLPFYFSKYRVIIQPGKRLDISRFRGDEIHKCFGYAMQQTGCRFNYEECYSDCSIFGRNSCFFQYAFKTMVPQNHKENSTIRNPNSFQPSPVLPHMHLDKKDYQPGDPILLDITLIGKAVQNIHDVFEALLFMCRAGIGEKKTECQLLSIHALKPDGSYVLVYHQEKIKSGWRIFPITLSDLLAAHPYPGAEKPVTFEFSTRLEIKSKDKNAPVNFYNLFRRLLYRVITVATLHCALDCSDIDETKALYGTSEIETISSSMVYEQAKRFSSSQNTWMPFGGRIGHITFNGNLAPFWPLLVLGEKIHVGKKASHGFGHYEMKYHPPFS